LPLHVRSPCGGASYLGFLRLRSMGIHAYTFAIIVLSRRTPLLISFNTFTHTHTHTHTPRIAFTSRGHESVDVASDVRETLNGHSRESNAWTSNARLTLAFHCIHEETLLLHFRAMSRGTRYVALALRHTAHLQFFGNFRTLMAGSFVINSDSLLAERKNC